MNQVKYLRLFLFSVTTLIMTLTATAQVSLEMGATGPAGNGPLTTAQAVTLFENGTTAYTPTITATYSLSNQQFPAGTLEGLPANVGINFGTTVSAPGTNSPMPTTQALYPLMNGISSPTNGLFTACRACAAGTGIDVTANRSVSLFLCSDALINSSTTNLQALNARIYYGDLTISFNRPVSNPVLHFVGMGGQASWTRPVSGVNTNYDLGIATEFDLVGTAVTLSKLSGNASLNVASASITNTSTRLGANSAGATLHGVTRNAASGTVVAQGTNITSITFKVYLKGDGGIIVNDTGTTVPPAVAGDEVKWSFAATFPAGSATPGAVGGDLMLFGVSLQKPVNISGTVFNDVNGLSDSTVNGTGIGLPGGTQLYANLVDGNGNVVASVPVAANGTYSVSAVGEGSYTVQISTNQGTVGAAAPAIALPAGWTQTGDNTGAAAGNDGTANGNQALTVTTTDVTQINFGIEQPPTPTSNTVANQQNPGGTTNATVAAANFSATDPDSGTITSIRVTAFPSNATSITINGTTYTSATFPAGGVTVPTNSSGNPTQTITVDPVDGIVDVVIPYRATDNAGKESSTTGNVTVPFKAVLSGTIFNDVNGLSDSTVNGTGIGLPGGTQLYANLLDSSGNVSATVALAADGTYQFPINATGTYTVQVSTNQGTVGAAAPATALPSGWVATGENIGVAAGNDGTVNSNLPVTYGAGVNSLPNVNFGIEQPPTPNSVTLLGQLNPGGIVNAVVPPTSFTATDPSSGTITSIRVTAFPSNATSITINGTTYTSATFPAGGVTVPTNASGNPTQVITVDPVSGNVEVVIPFRATDNAGKESSTNGTVTMPFTTAPTAVTMSDFTALSDGATTLLSWRTGSETDNLGYFVYRRQGKGELVRVNDEAIAGSAFKVAGGTTLTAGDAYYWRDEFVAGAEYYLEAVALNGKKQQFGPVTAKTDAEAAARLALAPNARTLSQLTNAREATPTTPLLPKAIRAALRAERGDDAAQRQLELAAGAAVKIGVKTNGWYRVSGAQLFAAGLRPDADANMLQLYADGVEMPLNIGGQRSDGGPLDASGVIEFYGFGLDERESDTRTYWLINGAQPGLRYGAAARVAPRGGRDGKDAELSPQSSALSTSFPATVELKERSIYFSALNNGEDTENFFGAGIVRNPVSRTLQVLKPDASAATPARLEVSLQGASSGSHRVRVQFNGQALGFVEWNGQTLRSQRFDLPVGALAEGANTVTFNAEADGDVSLADNIRLVYNRRYEAVNNQLLFTLNGRQSAAINGFNTPNIRVFDLTEPRRAFQVAAKIGSDAAGYAVQTPNGFGSRAMLAIADDQALSPAFVNANEPSAWTQAENSADFLIVTPKAFRTAAETLAQTRQSQGLRTAVVNLEDIFDELTGGSKRVSAVRSFLRYANQKWNHPAQYVLFLGDASYDPRDYLGLGGHDLVPTGYVATTYLETMSDESLTDFDGDGVGEMSVGRFPARTLAQAQAIVNKTLAYQPRPLNNGGALLIADQPDGYNFAAMNQETAQALPDGTNPTHWTRGAQPDAQFRQAILGALNQGPALVNFAGHGSVETWTGAGLLQTQDAAQLNNNAQLTVYVMLTCLNGYFGDETSESLAEALLKAPHGGAVAVWASTGLTAAPGQQLAGREFYRLAYGATPQRLGDAARTAKRATNDPEVRSTWTLFADPTLTVR